MVEKPVSETDYMFSSTSRLQIPKHPSILDTGTTGHFLLLTAPCHNIRPTTQPISCKLPAGQSIRSSHEADLPIPGLSQAARTAHLFPDLQHSLISVGLLCDDGCETTFTRDTATVTRNGAPILTGTRQPNGLWYFDLAHPHMPCHPQSAQHVSAYAASSSIAEVIQFMHASLGSPAQSTLLRAIRGARLTTWPGLTVANVRKHLPKSTATVKGHLDHIRKNVQSTKRMKPIEWEEDTDVNDVTPSPPISDGKRTHLIFAAIVNAPSESGQIYTDQTGRFPTTSRSGNKYIMVLYDYDSNSILIEAMRNKTDNEMIRAYQLLHDRLVERGVKPRLQRLDNEASRRLKQFISAQDIELQLVPPRSHRANAAERAIRTFKNHFIAILCGTDKLFPMNLWDKLLAQSEITLNLLRPARMNPRLSAYAYLNGQFDYNATPLAPPGSKAIIFEPPSVRASWSPHGLDGWYVGPAPEHYRCYKVHVTVTNAIRTGDTVEFFPQHTTMPKLSSADAATYAIRDLVDALKHPHPATPFDVGDKQLLAIRQLAEIFDVSDDNDTAAPRVAGPAAQPTAVTVPTPAPTPAPTHHYNLRSRATANAASSSVTNAMPNNDNDVLTYMPLANAVIDQETGQALEYRDLIKHPKYRDDWLLSAANEFGRLAQGIGGRVEGTDTIKFIHRDQVPRGRTVTYGRFVCLVRPQKAEPNRTRLTVGGDRVHYPGPVTTSTADLTTCKIHFNSVISTPNARFTGVDIKNFYLNTPLDRPEYMRIHFDLIPPEVVTHYKLDKIADKDGYVYIEINKGMYGLPQAGILANKLLAKRLAPHGYYQSPYTRGLWLHQTRPTSFPLIVDDFGIKHVGKDDALHLINILKQYYEVSVDWEGSLFAGIKLDWDYENGTVDLSMPNYIPAALTAFQHPTPAKPQDSPHPCNPPQYGKKIQLPEPLDTSKPLGKADSKRIQSITGTLLYYARAVDSTMLTPLSAIAAEQNTATDNTMKKTNQLLDYAASHPDAKLRYHNSDMQLKVHSDASYLNEKEARTRFGGHHYLTNAPPKQDINNGAILNPTSVLDVVVSSAAEAEIGGLFKNAKEAVPTRTTLTELGYKQNPTPLVTDNSTADGIANDTIKQQRTRAMDMRFHWLRDRVKQKQFAVYWEPGNKNKADYFSKHHTAAHHRRMRPQYLQTSVPSANSALEDLLRGCVETPVSGFHHSSSDPLQPMTIAIATALSARLSNRQS